MNPTGTEMAGQPVTVIREHDRIHSTYVCIGTPATSPGYSNSIGNGETWVTGHAR